MKATNKVIDKHFLFGFLKQNKKEFGIRNSIIFHYANFVFRLLAKKIAFYLLIFFYLLVIFVYSFLIPTLAKQSPYTTFTFPTFSALLVVVVGAVFSYFAIEIYRSPIEDGTELIILSKRIKRSHIFVTKYLVFFLVTIALAFCGSVISLFSYATFYGVYRDNLLIFVGIFVASVVIGLLFGNIAILLSLYTRKIVSFLIVIGSIFLVTIASIVSAIIVESPGRIAARDDSIKNFSQVTLVNLDGKEKDQNGVGFTRGLVSQLSRQDLVAFSLTRNRTREQLLDEDAARNYQLAFNQSPFKTLRYFDPVLQLSTLFTIGQVSVTNSANQLISSFINVPFQLEFIDSEFGNLTEIKETDPIAKTHSWFGFKTNAETLAEANRKAIERAAILEAGLNNTTSTRPNLFPSLSEEISNEDIDRILGVEIPTSDSGIITTPEREEARRQSINKAFFLLQLAGSSTISTTGERTSIRSMSQQATNLGISVSENKFNDFFSPIDSSASILNSFIQSSPFRKRSDLLITSTNMQPNDNEALDLTWLLTRTRTLSNSLLQLSELTSIYISHLLNHYLQSKNYINLSEGRKENVIRELNDVVLTSYNKYMNQSNLDLKELLEEIPSFIVDFQRTNQISQKNREVIEKLVTLRLLNFRLLDLNTIFSPSGNYGDYALSFLDNSPIGFNYQDKRYHFTPLLHITPNIFFNSFKTYKVIAYFDTLLLFIAYVLIGFAIFYAAFYNFNRKDIF